MNSSSNVLNTVGAAQSIPHVTWFGQFLAWYRTVVARVTPDQVDQCGGPSRGTQTPIEKGDADAVSAETLAKYEHAYTQLVPPDSDYNVTMLQAAFALFRNQANDQDRTQKLQDTNYAWNNQRFIFLGLQIPSGEEVAGQGLELLHDTRVHYDSEDRREFVQQAGRIAVQQPAVTLVPAQHEPHIFALALQSWRKVKPQGGRRNVLSRTPGPRVPFDPIGGVCDLDEALTRAEALGLHGSDAIDLAWVMLVANELAAHESADPISLIDTVFTDHVALDSFKRLFDQFGAEPNLAELAALTRRVLSPWRNEYLLATWSVRLENTAEGQKFLCAREIHDQSLGDIREQSVWTYDDTQFPLLPNVLASQYTPAVVLTPEQVRLHHVGPAEPVYGWFPVYGDRSLLRNNATRRWIAVQTPPTYGDTRRHGPADEFD
ncbi:hypothetical protein [Mycobacterium attenuatum]|uniref:hypothetical protein n=1 Tax=Mycobacterium attenuatum TaxID=2341086 RepID=UPI000F02066A|nr:hypothetical protein [Mycobacterium attenuatum]VBA61492.1 hypothetical protein LAUMK41_04868 [Mycobacterium attenuatum]